MGVLLAVIASLVLCVMGADPPQICEKSKYCEWPVSDKPNGVKNCKCPTGFLNLEDSCCLSQWWIIGLSLAVGILLLITIFIMVYLLMMMKKKNKKNQALLELNQKRLQESATQQDTRQNMATDPLSPYKPADYTLYSNQEGLEYRNQAFEREDDFQNQSQMVINQKRSNLVGYRPTALASEEVMNEAKRRSQEPPYKSSYNQPFTSAPKQASMHAYYSDPRMKQEFVIERPMLN